MLNQFIETNRKEIYCEYHNKSGILCELRVTPEQEKVSQEELGKCYCKKHQEQVKEDKKFKKYAEEEFAVSTFAEARN